MSIVFSSDRPSVKLGYQVTCYLYGSDSNWRGPVFASPEQAVYDHSLADHDTSECDGSASTVFPAYDTDLDPQLQISNTNGLRLLESLGLSTPEEPQYFGTVSSDDFLGRTLIALALEPADEGIPLVDSITSGGARLIECGRPVGYLQQKLESLRDVITFAQKHNSNITWG